jgi:tetratricopeptide (TPR) repeat protein
MSEKQEFQWCEVRPAERKTASIAVAFCVSGNAWSRKGLLDRAIEDYDAALTMEPSLAEALVNRGNARARKGDLRRAIADFNAALRLDPRDVKARKNRELALQKQRESDSKSSHNDK